MPSKDLPTNKTEAIRRAVEALGYHASVDQILDYVHTHFERQPDAPERPGAAAPEGAPNAARRGKK